ncbi:MAG: hypothetical protein CEN89_199 [Candidatus Berkelbacteria bacterium Licking1014_7]|uniref:50S ribosomal protein L28 n=1 Tax=Candidatus Berkelbacteria bacterium Licking1014_7 TaxID=2017147 RepID=A0A554LKL6_9BACT|nr:MAG: hypothetical protein CEN89_199 [Candidatus Berkelbacteria bacterium Licking1014_7]
MIRLRIPKQVCAICNKGSVIGYNRPKSLHRTKKVVNPNLQKMKFDGKIQSLVCTGCMRTMKKKSDPLRNNFL